MLATLRSFGRLEHLQLDIRRVPLLLKPLLRLIEVLSKLDNLLNTMLPQRLIPFHRYSPRNTRDILNLSAVQLQLCQSLYLVVAKVEVDFGVQFRLCDETSPDCCMSE